MPVRVGADSACFITLPGRRRLDVDWIDDAGEEPDDAA
jgi:hypothetical protein